MRTELTKARKAKGYTHQQLADIVGIDRGHYTHIENGTRNPSLNVAAKIASALDVKMDDIFSIQSDDG